LVRGKIFYATHSFKVLFILIFFIGAFFSKMGFAGLEVVHPAMITKICKDAPDPDISSVTIYRDMDGGISYYLSMMDPLLVSHTTYIYYDREGKSLLMIPERPLDPHSFEGKRLQAKKKKLLNPDATESEKVECEDFLKE